MDTALGISFESLLAYEEEQAGHWEQWFTGKPHLLKVDFGPGYTIHDWVFHIFVVHFHTGQRLLGEEMTSKTKFRAARIGNLFEIGHGGRQKMRQYLAHATPEDLVTPRTFPSPTLGEFVASPRKLLLHGLLHGVRHWAQIATVLRQENARIDWSTDVLFSKALD